MKCFLAGKAIQNLEQLSIDLSNFLACPILPLDILNILPEVTIPCFYHAWTLHLPYHLLRYRLANLFLLLQNHKLTIFYRTTEFIHLTICFLQDTFF